METWIDTAKVDLSPSRLERICWPYDKYPDMQQLTAGAEVTLLDTDGPGVVTNIHSARMDFLDAASGIPTPREPDACSRVMIELTYDNHETPDISMPFYDFLGDPEGTCEYYSTVYISKVRISHNFRLPIPFRKHLKIVLKNPSKTDLISYTELQWKLAPQLPDDCGILKVSYLAGQAQIPEQVITLADLQGSGMIRAHWLQLGTDFPGAFGGELVCEGNQEYYVDGETSPSLEYLGTEDAYGHSWGLSGVSCDGFTGIVKMAHPTHTRTEIAMLRCRTGDSVSFRKSLQVRMDYRYDYFSRTSTNPLLQRGVFRDRERVSFGMDYKSCFYYYSAD